VPINAVKSDHPVVGMVTLVKSGGEENDGRIMALG